MFFTVAAQARGSRVLVEHIAALREAVRVTRAERPFELVAWVVLPDHLHAVWRLPEGDADYSVRWGAIKARFTRSVRRVGFHPTIDGSAGGERGMVVWNPTLRSPSKVAKGDAGLWQRRSHDRHPRDEEAVAAAAAAAAVRYCW